VNTINLYSIWQFPSYWGIVVKLSLFSGAST